MLNKKHLTILLYKHLNSYPYLWIDHDNLQKKVSLFLISDSFGLFSPNLPFKKDIITQFKSGIFWYFFDQCAIWFINWIVNNISFSYRWCWVFMERLLMALSVYIAHILPYSQMEKLPILYQYYRQSILVYFLSAWLQ